MDDSDKEDSWNKDKRSKIDENTDLRVINHNSLENINDYQLLNDITKKRDLKLNRKLSH